MVASAVAGVRERARQVGAFLMVVGLMAVLFGAVAPSSGAAPDPNTPSTTLITAPPGDGVVVWDGNGTTNGYCNTKQAGDPAGWVFILTSPKDGGPFQITAQFKNAGVVQGSVLDGDDNGSVKFIVEVDVNDQLLAAWAVTGDSSKNPVLTVTHCNIGTSTTTTEASTTTTEATTTTTQASTTTTQRSTTTTGGGGGGFFVPETTTTQAPTTTTTQAPEVAGEQIENTTTTEAPATTEAPVVAPQSQVLGEQLARTGSDSRELVFVAGLALLLGGAAIFASDKLSSAHK
jgi:hypothetical protein